MQFEFNMFHILSTLKWVLMLKVLSLFLGCNFIHLLWSGNIHFVLC